MERRTVRASAPTVPTATTNGCRALRRLPDGQLWILHGVTALRGCCVMLVLGRKRWDANRHWASKVYLVRYQSDVLGAFCMGFFNIFNGMGANGRIFVVQASKRHLSAEGPGPLNAFDIHFLVHLQLPSNYSIMWSMSKNMPH